MTQSENYDQLKNKYTYSRREKFIHCCCGIVFLTELISIVILFHVGVSSKALQNLFFLGLVITFSAALFFTILFCKCGNVYNIETQKRARYLKRFFIMITVFVGLTSCLVLCVVRPIGTEVCPEWRRIRIRSENIVQLNIDPKLFHKNKCDAKSICLTSDPYSSCLDISKTNKNVANVYFNYSSFVFDDKNTQNTQNTKKSKVELFLSCRVNSCDTSRQFPCCNDIHLVLNKTTRSILQVKQYHEKFWSVLHWPMWQIVMVWFAIIVCSIMLSSLLNTPMIKYVIGTDAKFTDIQNIEI